ncbi:MAG: AmmeMemoRadiSam system protein B [Acidobacteria bacterium]|nr:MAG: AmmeMemoRadiSam system protein B [Acidobacteriota bacterium]
MKPKVRFLTLKPLDGSFLVSDPLGVSPELVLSWEAALLLSLMDGERELVDIKAEFFKRTLRLISDEELKGFIWELHRLLLLDNHRFREHLKRLKEELLSAGVRRAYHAGLAYPSDRVEALGFLKLEEREKRDMLGLIVPHMDLRVARETYWEGYGRIKEHKELIIILGVSHYWHEMPFSALPLDMETPFGILKTDTELFRKLQELYSFDLAHDILSYRKEHSIEFASLYAKMLFPEAKALALIVSYGSLDFLKELAENLLRLIDRKLHRTFVISSIDLSHVGKKFGDLCSYDPSFRDREYLNLIGELKTEEAFRLLESDQNSTRIDGQYTNVVFSHILRCAGIKSGELFDYKVYHEEPTDSKVSYASMGF